LPRTLEIAAFLERADPRDAFISPTAKSLDDLPRGAKIGTSSLRRQAQILARRPDLKVLPLRGNVDTRLRKLADGEADATILALAGMQRLGIAEKVSSVFDTEIMLPSAGQGALGIEIRRDDENMRGLLAPLNDTATSACVSAERAFLLALDGSCQTPIAALAQLEGSGQLHLEALAARPDGSSIIRLQHSGAMKDAESIGRTLGDEMKSKLPADFFIRTA
jgi:hydroxymethylbilane synthase